MSRLKALLSNQTKCLLKTRNPSSKIPSPSPSFIIRRTLNSYPQKQTKTPLSALFQAAGGTEAQREVKNIGLKREVRNLKGNPKEKKKENQGPDGNKPQKVKCLVELPGCEKKQDKVKKMVKVRRERREVRALKDLSQLAESFIRHLFAKGYFNKASFLEDNKLDFGYFGNSYGRDFIKFAAYEFGKDHQDIAKWLPGNHLKNVVLFGCPSLDKNNVFAAKRLRKFFKIQEHTVCSRCALKDSCEYANKSLWGIGTNSLLLVDVMKIITLYALDLLPAKLTVPDEVKDSINQLLKMVVKLSQST
ncbi:Detected protein of unknown function [Hibiscus syriacus]|uniref:Uncharacterized protein n=1 Tax=Hibiscus syriacus TaxID=106335 RepID=A0A6A2YKQ2_HIBSY|nr:uncharacterized protein LOC120163463 [Hibiscus syriacus]KAE8678104.1 Detected protein of unknown function [Hibiscus syriacus]